MKIYLAGGMKGDWQDRIIQGAPGHTYFDPREHSYEKDPSVYTELDLKMIDQCDWVLCYMDNSNPGGYNMCFEAGYACAKHMMIIYVCEDTSERQRYFGMLKSSSSFFFDSIEKVIQFLNS